MNPIRSFKAAARGSRSVGWRGEGGSARSDRSSHASAGNFGQGVAYAARALDPGGRHVAQRHPAKVARMRALGATVLEEGEDFDDARGASEQFAIETGAELLVDGDDPRIAQGAASLALEITAGVEAGALPSIAVAAVPTATGC